MFPLIIFIVGALGGIPLGIFIGSEITSRAYRGQPEHKQPSLGAL